MMQKIVEKVADDANEVLDPIFGRQFELRGKCVRSRMESV